MKRFIMLVFAVATIGAASAQNTTKDIDSLDTFTAIRLSGNVSVQFVPTDGNQSMSIDFKGNDPKRFAWSVRDGVLRISFSANTKSEVTMVTVWYNSPIRNIYIRRADMRSDEAKFAQLTDITVWGGGKLTAAVNCDDLKLSLDDKSVAVLGGSSKYITADITRGSALDCRQVECTSLKLDALESSEVYVNASEHLVVTARGTSSVFYAGMPDIIRSKVSGGATFNPIEGE